MFVQHKQNNTKQQVTTFCKESGKSEMTKRIKANWMYKKLRTVEVGGQGKVFFTILLSTDGQCARYVGCTWSVDVNTKQSDWKLIKSNSGIRTISSRPTSWRHSRSAHSSIPWYVLFHERLSLWSRESWSTRERLWHSRGETKHSTFKWSPPSIRNDAQQQPRMRTTAHW